MKLKKLAAGILAAVMAVTSAISAPVTASAAADDVQVTINLDTDWLSAAIFSNAATDVTVAGENLTDNTNWWLQVSRQNDDGTDTAYASAFGTSNEDGYSQALTFTTAMDSVKVILVSWSNALSKNVGYTVTIDTTDAVDGVLNVGLANNGDPAAEMTNNWWYETPFTYSVLTKAEGIPDGTKVAINDNPPYNYQGMFSVSVDGLTSSSTGADIVANASQIEISFPINGVLCDGEEFDASKITYQVQPKIWKQVDEDNQDWPWLTVGSGTYADGVATITADLASVITDAYADYLFNSINVVAMVSYDDASAKVDMYIGDVTVTATPGEVEPDPVYVTAISIPETLALETGASDTLKATLTPADADDTTITWKSSKESVATVDANGKVTAVAAGTAVITATANGAADGETVSDTCTVTVTDPAVYVTAISIPETLALETGASETLKATLTPADADDTTITWKSSKESVATVDANGKVTAVAAGTAVITATANGAADGKTVSDTCTVTVTDPIDPADIVPQNVTAKYAKNAITVTWDAVEGADSYRVRRNDGTGWVNYKDLTATSLVDDAVEAGTKYSYAVYAIANGVISDASNIVNVTVPDPSSIIPQNVAADTNDGQITISWDDVTDATKYRVRRNDGTGWVNYKDTTDCYISDTEVEQGATYRYAVYALVDGAWSGASTIVSATVAVEAAEGVTATAGDSSITIKWTAVDGADGYRIRRNDGTGWKNYADVTENSFEDTDVDAGKKYRYAVYVKINNVWGAASNIVAATVTPAAAENLEAEAAIGSVVLTWDEVEGATKYRIRRNDGTGWTNYADVTETSYEDTAVEAGKKYRYAVYALVNGTWGDATDIVTATVPVPAVDDLAATADAGAVVLEWTAIDGAEYRVRRNDGTGWVNYASGIADAEYTDTDVEAGTYRYAVYVNINGTWSAASNIVSITLQ